MDDRKTIRTILNVANRLPVTVGETIQKSSGGLVSALEGVSTDHYRLQWIGWPGGVIEDLEEQQRVEKLLVEELGFHPIFLTAHEIARYYDGFSNASLWPILHYNRPFMHYSEEDWESYRSVNQRFARSVLDVAKDDNLVWVHDYHLMLLPGMLREARPDLRIGYFLHTPFPSSEFFRCHPRRVELIRGVLGADIVGFHTYGYLRHFRSSALRLLGLEAEMGTIAHGNHRSSLGVYPIGIHSAQFKAEVQRAAFHAKRAELEANWKGKRIILSVERLDYSKGLLRRLDAIELFLAERENRDDIVFIFVSVPSRGEVKEYQSLRERIEGEVGRINGLYATTRNSPIHFIHQSVPFTELCALYSLADIALVTPLVDGMNLVAKEYVACQGGDPGVLILSEFAGVAQEFVNALIVNPFNNQEVANTIQLGLDMGLDERRKRMGYLQARAFQYDADYWANTFLDDLVDHVQFNSNPIELAEAEEAILRKLTAATSTALFLDYDGTLREFEQEPDQAGPTHEMRALFTQLEAAPADVFLISGRKGSNLLQWFGEYAFTLIAEHGSAYRNAGSDEWKTLNSAADFSWKESVLEILRHYEGSTPGSFVEVKHSAIVWHYRQSDPEFGRWKANQLMSELYEMLPNFPVEIHHGKKVIEVSSIHVNKGAAVEHFLRNSRYSLTVCAGDDQTDEAMFRLERPDVLTIKIGEGDSRAQYRIPDPARFRDLLRRWLQTGS